MLAKTGVHHYSGNNIELGTACGKYYRVCTLAIIDPGMSLEQCSDQMGVCEWFLCSPVSSSTEQVTCKSDHSPCCHFLSVLALNYNFFSPSSCSFWVPGSENLELLLLMFANSSFYCQTLWACVVSTCQSAMRFQWLGSNLWYLFLSPSARTWACATCCLNQPYLTVLNLRQTTMSCPASQNNTYKNKLYAGRY